METIRIDILDPKTKKLLKDLADRDLIKIRKENTTDFGDLLKKIRSNSADKLGLEEITKEVESVRDSRYKDEKSL
ncbi:hypothetical protein [Zunongwangia sp. H14]|uniref:hypothetical protein n=1 Tax=Zunongwangia sp. H14 TaxID=3240792 RepID=UPI0035616190